VTAQLKLPPMMTVTDFLDWPGDGSGQRYELIDGELRAMAPGADSHNTIVMTFGTLIWNHLQTTGSTCRVVSAPGIQPRIRADWNVRIPDLGVTCAPNRIGDVMTPEPVLLIEVLSPGNKSQTYENVRAYATIPSVREIIVLHSTAIKAEILLRDGQGDWPSNPTEIGNRDTLTLSSIKASFQLAQLYASTHLAPSTPR
jgi:Uma2 family endonuclease